MSRTFLKTVATVVALAMPICSLAAAFLDADDSIAGIGLSIGIAGAGTNDTLDIVVTDPSGSAIRIPIQTDASGKATAIVPGSKAERAGTYTARAMKGTSEAATAVSINVAPDSADSYVSSVQTWTPVISPDGRDRGEVSVTMRDQYGNALEGRTVTLVSSRSDDRVTALSSKTDSTGTQHFSVTTTNVGTITLRAIDLLSAVTINQTAEIRAGNVAAVGGYDTVALNSAPLTSRDLQGRRFYFNAQVAPAFDIIDRFEVTVPAQMTPGEEAPTITVRAVDRTGKTVENYTGTVRFVTTDPQATVPNFGTYTFMSRDLGEKSFALALTFRTPGPQTFRAEDTSDAAIFGEGTVQVGAGSSAQGSINVASHKDGDYVNTLTINVEGRGPRLANLIVMGGDRDYTGSTDDSGNFSIPVTLSPGQRDFTLRVRDDQGRNDSGSIHLILDQEKPIIEIIQFAPENPEEGEKVLIVVQSEPDLAQAIFRLRDRVNGTPKEITLSENPTQSGSYQGFFTAPSADMYQPTVTVMDKAGNVTELSAQLAVGGKTLPKVVNVQAEPRVDAVELTWDPVPGEVSGYRIYIGDEDNNYLYTLDTGRVITKATVKGLTQGQNYSFAVTALRGSQESTEKSDPVGAQVLGFTLEITPQDSALRVEWTSLTTDLPLSSFTLSYGTSADSLSEERTLNGELRDTIIRDLLPGVRYFLQITPVTVTGDTLDELAAEGNGTPTGNGFKPAARDDVPFDVAELPEGPLHSGAPLNPSSGIPSTLLIIGAAIAAAGVYLRWRHRKSLAQTSAFLQAVQAQYQR